MNEIIWLLLSSKHTEIQPETSFICRDSPLVGFMEVVLRRNINYKNAMSYQAQPEKIVSKHKTI